MQTHVQANTLLPARAHTLFNADEQHAVEPETVDELMARIEQLELLKEVIISHDDDDDAAPVREFAAHEDTD